MDPQVGVALGRRGEEGADDGSGQEVAGTAEAGSSWPLR